MSTFLSSCFGRKQVQEDERDPLLGSSDSNDAETARGRSSTTRKRGGGRVCGTPFPPPGRTEEDIRIDLETAGFLEDYEGHSDNQRDQTTNLHKHDPEHKDDHHTAQSPLLDELITVLAALNAHKLPSQDQISHFLRVVLGSELLKVSGKGSDSRVANSIHQTNGTGPSSKKGRRVLADIRGVVQAALQFGMEKNDDDKVQDFIYQLSQIDGSDTIKPDVNVPALPGLQLKESSKRALGKGREGAETIKDSVPSTTEIQNDTQILLHALRTLFISLFTSSAFRLLLTDLLGIARDVVARAAGEVKRTAEEVGEAAGEVEKSFREQQDETVLGSGNEGEGYGVDLTVEEMKGKSKQVFDQVASNVKDAKDRAMEQGDELLEVGKDVADKAKEELIERMQQILSRAQEDPASRSALRSILILVQKYVGKVEEIGEQVVEVVGDVAERVEDIVVEGVSNVSATLKGKGKDDGDEKRVAPLAPYSYPPPSMLYLPVPQSQSQPRPPSHTKPGTDASGNENPLKLAMEDLKSLLERLGQGYPLDGVMEAFISVAKDLQELPVEVGVEARDVFEKEVKDKDPNGGGDVEKPKEVGGEGVGGTVGAATGTVKVKNKHRNGSSAGVNDEKESAGKTFSSVTPTPTHGPMKETSGENKENSPEQPSSKSHAKLSPNPLRQHFTHVGEFLDKALDEPGWAMSRSGGRELERLFDEGVELVNVVGEVVMEGVGEGIVEGVISAAESKDGADKAGGEKQGADSEDAALRIRRRFKLHVKLFMRELEAYVSAVEKDKTTMKFVRAVDALGESVSDLFFAGPHPRSKSRSKRKRNDGGTRPTSFARELYSSLQWTEWIGWAIPRLMKMLPAGVIPIPSLEAKSESGGWEGGLYALFARPNGAEGGGGGVKTTLVPDEVVLRRWSEVRIEMGDDPSSPSPSSLSQLRNHIQTNATDLTHNDQPRITSTSQIFMHMDGIRAQVESMGYYFRYGQPDNWVGYEDEGVVSVDVGMGSGVHGGFGCEVEVELTSDNKPEPDTGNQIKSGSGGIIGALGELTNRGPVVEASTVQGVGEGVEGEGDFSTIPEIVVQPPGQYIPPPTPRTATIVEGEAVETPIEDADLEIEEDTANMDVQRAVATAGSAVGHQREVIASMYTGLPYSLLLHRPIDPLFRVVNVHVNMEGVKVKLEKSRHWMLNKVVVQPLAGAIVGNIVKGLVEEKLRKGLEDLALALGKLVRDVEGNREVRKEKLRREKMKSKMRALKEGREDEAYDDDEDEDSIADTLGDWWSAILQSSAGWFDVGKDGGMKDDDADLEVQTSTNVEATMKGIVFETSTTTTELQDTPAMVYDKRNQLMHPFVNGAGSDDVEQNTTDLTVAIGGGAQLFPSKGGPYDPHAQGSKSYGARNDSDQSVGHGEEEGLIRKVKRKVDNAVGVADEIEEAWGERTREIEAEGSTGRKAWKTDVFTFRGW